MFVTTRTRTLGTVSRRDRHIRVWIRHAALRILLLMHYGVVRGIHAALLDLRRERGQGTVEYVGLILLLAVVRAGVVKAADGFSDDKGIAKTSIDKRKDAIASV